MRGTALRSIFSLLSELRFTGAPPCRFSEKTEGFSHLGHLASKRQIAEGAFVWAGRRSLAGGHREERHCTCHCPNEVPFYLLHGVERVPGSHPQ